MQLLELTWAPLRVIVAAPEDYGPSVTLPLYTAIGKRIHVDGRIDERLLAEALTEVGLPASLFAARQSVEFDEVIRRSHERGISRVGSDVGTPIIQTDDFASFGPVLNPTPRGEVAARVWDVISQIAPIPEFYELKRSRTIAPVLITPTDS